MKKLIFILALAMIAIAGCAEKNSVEIEGQPLQKSGEIAAVAEFKSSHPVNADTAKAWVKNYKNWLVAHGAEKVKQALKTGAIAEIPNSRSVWFSVEQLEGMINKIKAENGDGIRFYYASYGNMKPSVDSCTNMPFNYSGLNTLLMVPTKRDNCFHRDYYNAANPITTMDIENKGEICPPPADCKLTGATLVE